MTARLRRCRLLTRSLLLCAALLGLNACAHLKPLESPREQSLAPADSLFWRNVADNRRGDWYYLLNTGEDALAWRPHAIDSTATNIDKHFDAYWNNRWSVPIGRLVQPPLNAPGLAAHRS